MTALLLLVLAVGCHAWQERVPARLVPRSAVEALAEATGEGWRREK